MAKKTASIASEATGRAPADPIAAGVFAFEGDWQPDLRDPWSIEPMLHAMRDLGGISYIRRSIGTVPELEYYINKCRRP